MGREQLRESCTFFLKTGVCRFGDRCSRAHPDPENSSTLLFPGMYSHFELEHNLRDEYDTDIGLEYEEGETYNHFKEFYNDVLPELKIIGKVLQFKVCCNYEPHLRGNVYVQYQREEDAHSAFAKFNGRFYGGKQLSAQFVNIAKWKSAVCGLYGRNRCPKGKNCNFLHVFRNPNNEFREADRDFESTPRHAVGYKNYDRFRGYHNGNQQDRHSYQRSRSRDSKSRSRSHYRSRSRSEERKMWRSPGGSLYRSRSRSGERKKRRRSRSNSRSKSRLRSRSRSPDRRKKRHSRSRSPSRSYSKSNKKYQKYRSRSRSRGLSPSHRSYSKSKGKKRGHGYTDSRETSVSSSVTGGKVSSDSRLELTSSNTSIADESTSTSENSTDSDVQSDTPKSRSRHKSKKKKKPGKQKEVESEQESVQSVQESVQSASDISGPIIPDSPGKLALVDEIIRQSLTENFTV